MEQEKYLKELTFKERCVFADNIENMLFNKHSYIGSKILLGMFYYLIGIKSAITICEKYFMPMGFFTNISDSEILVALRNLEEGKDEGHFFSIGFKFAHDFASSKSENKKIVNESLNNIAEVFNEKSGRVLTQELRKLIYSDWRAVTIDFLNKAVNK